ncbi:MAG: twin-arginine translocation signal domain-containing protein, partial [Planctomycetota bacterium]
MARSKKETKPAGTTRRDFLKASTVAASAAVSGSL